MTVLLPVSIFMYRVQQGAADPTLVFLPILLATSASTLAGLLSVALMQRLRLWDPVVLAYLLPGALLLGGFMALLATLSATALAALSSLLGNLTLFGIILLFLLVGALKRVAVYESFVEGAREGFDVAKSLLPYLVAMLCAIGVLRADNPIKLSGESTTRMIIEGQPEWLAQASFDGDLAKLPVTGKLQAPFRADMRGELLELNTNFHWQGKATVHNFDLRAFGAGGALGIVSGTLDVGGEMNAFHARGPLLVPGLGEGLFDMVFEGNYADDKVNATHYETTHRATGSHVDGAGTIEVVENGPKLDLAGNWSELRWPLQQRFTAEKPQIFSSPAGSYTLAGVWPYALTARGELYVPQIEPMTVAMRGALHKDHLDVDELDLGAFGGQARLAGNARWTPDESWALEGDVKGLDPATLRRGFGGALDFHMKASGAPFGGDNLDFAFANLSGQLRGSPARPSRRASKCTAPKQAM